MSTEAPTASFGTAAQGHSTLEVLSPESGIEVVDVPVIGTASPASSPDRFSTKAIQELPSPNEAMPEHPGLVVAHSPRIMPLASPSGYTSSGSFAHSLRAEKGGSDAYRQQRRICHLRPKYFWIALILTLVILAAAIGAAVGVAVRNSKRHSNTQKSSSASNTSPAANQTLSGKTGLASVAWNDTEGVTQHRVYYQDAGHFVRESSWDPINLAWIVKDDPIGIAKPDTPLAAAVAASKTFSFVGLLCLTLHRNLEIDPP